MDRVRGPLGRARVGVLQRADGPEHEDAVDAPDRLVARLARPELRRARRAAFSGRGDGSLLRRASKRARGVSRFCSGTRRATLLVLAAILGLIVFAVVRATWHPIAPLRIARRRTWGQVISASARMYVQRPRLFLEIGLILIPITIATTMLQWLVLQLVDLLGVGHGPGRRRVRAPLPRDRDDTHAPRPRLSSRQRRRVRSSRSTRAGRSGRWTPTGSRSGGCAPCSARSRSSWSPWLVLTATGFLIPVALWLAVRWCLLAPVVELEGEVGWRALRRSGRLVRRRWIRVASLVGVSAVVALAAGPLLGVALIFLTNMPFALLNIVAGVVYALALPYVAVVTAYVYFDARARVELEPVGAAAGASRRDRARAGLTRGIRRSCARSARCGSRRDPGRSRGSCRPR